MGLQFGYTFNDEKQRVWGLKKPENQKELAIFVSELSDVMEDLNELGFEITFNLKSPPTMEIRRNRRKHTKQIMY